MKEFTIYPGIKFPESFYDSSVLAGGFFRTTGVNYFNLFREIENFRGRSLKGRDKIRFLFTEIIQCNSTTRVLKRKVINKILTDFTFRKDLNIKKSFSKLNM